MLQVSGVGFTWSKSVVDFPTCRETVATNVAIKGLSGAFGWRE